LLNSSVAANIIFAVCLIDAFFIEPGLLTTTRVKISKSNNQSSTGEIKIIHISDIHYKKDTGLTMKLLNVISNEKPDLICITGDIYQMGEYDDAGFKSFMTRLCDIAPTYFICGYDDEQTIMTASSGKIHYASAKSLKLQIHNNTVEIAGMPDTGIPEKSSVFNGKSDFKIILNHSPDRLDEASQMKADLFLAGHTHGGQIRLPFWGAVITNCETGKRYEYGSYRNGNMNAFVTRGIGMEPKPAPQARFLCPPEVVVIEIY
jgi:predicted MPP superfamily phosphohydrolase